MVPNLHVNPLFEQCENCHIDATEEKVVKKKKRLRRVDSLKIGLMVAAGFGVNVNTRPTRGRNLIMYQVHEYPRCKQQIYQIWQ